MVKNSKIAQAFKKVKLDIQTLKNQLAEVKHQVRDDSSYKELKKEVEILRSEHENEIESLKHGLTKADTSELKAEIKQLKRDLNKVNNETIKEDIKKLKQKQKEQKKELDELRSLVEKSLKSEDIKQRIDELEDDMREQFDLYNRLIQGQQEKKTQKKVQQQNEDEVIHKFASSIEEEEKGFTKWLFSREK